MNKSRFLRLAGFVLCIEFLFVAVLFISKSNSPVAPDEVLPTQMVLPVASTPIPVTQVANNAVSQPVGAVPVNSVAEKPTEQRDQAVSPTGTPLVEVPINNTAQPPAVDPLANVPRQPTQPPPPVEQAPVPNQVVIQFKPDTKPADINAYVASVGGTVSQKIDALNTVIVNLPAGQTAPVLPSSSAVTHSEPDYFVTAQMDVPPSDPLYSQQWGLPVIGAPDAWKTLPTDAAKVTVAVIDSGVCADHPDLNGRILAGWDFVENDAVPQDEYGHGCAIAGIIAANVDDGAGMAGVAPNAMILPLRVLDANGVGTYSNVAAAIVRAANEGAQVINLSLGGSNPSSMLENAINYAVSKNVTVVAAAGNTGSNILYPAAYGPVISVGSVDSNLQRSSFSSYLPQLDTLAPGSNILATAPNQSYSTESGTSFAAAAVSGVVALNLAAGNSLVFDGSVLTFGQHEQVVMEPSPSAPFTPVYVDDGEVQPLAVIGPVDSRTLVNPTTGTPNSAVALVLFRKGTVSYICSGAIIAPQYVLTAGHCVYDEGIYSTNIAVYPGNNGAAEPFGGFSATLAYVPQQWIDTATGDFSYADVDYDWALLRLSSSVSGSITPFALSSFSDATLNSISNYTDAGYPADKCSYLNGTVGYCPTTQYPVGWQGVVAGQGDTQWTASGPNVPAWLSTYLIGNQIDTFGGQSGSPLYVTDNNQPLASRYIITGVLSHSRTPIGNSCYGTIGALCPSQNSGNYFRRVTTDMLEALISTNVPFTNPACYAVNLTVSGAGTATRSLARSAGCATGSYTYGTVFSLSAVATAGNVFNGWTGATGDLNTTYTVTGPATITANFIPQPTPAANMVMSRGYYDDRDGDITYNGGWTMLNTTGPSANTLMYTGSQNAIAQFAFNGGGFTIYRSTYTNRGPMEVCVDTSCQTIDNSSATFQWTVPYTLVINGAITTHNVRIRNLTANLLDLDAIEIIAPNPVPLGVGNYQENNGNFAYYGNWLSTSIPAALGGGWRFTNDASGSVIFTTDATVGRVVIYRTTYVAGVYGTMQVYVDGSLLTTMNNTSSGLMFGVPFTFSVASGSSHVIELRNVGSTYSGIDQISLLSEASRLATGTYQETDANLSYSGVWTSAAGQFETRSYTNDPNATVSFDIDGSVGRVTIYRTTYVAGVYGSMQVYVDGALTTTINNTSASFQLGQPFAFNVAPGNHTILLKNVGSTYSDLDQIVLAAPPAALSAGTYQETDANLVYSGTWASGAGQFNNRTYTNDPNASVTFNINNTVGLVTIYRTTYVAGVYGALQVYLDGNATPFMSINNTSATFQMGQPFTFAVIPGNHTVTIKNVGSTYSDLDQIVLAAATTPLTLGTYQEDNTALIYNGTWASAAGQFSNRKYTNDPFGNVSFTIDNTVGRVTIYRTTYVAGVYGAMQVYLDDSPTPFTTINNTSASFQMGQPFTFSVTPGNHIITLKNMGNTYSDLDQIVLAAPPAALSAGTYQETDANLIYSGTWTSAAGQFNNRTYTNDPNASVTFNIDNTVGRVTIYRTTYVAGVYGALQVYLDGNATPFMSINNTSANFQLGQPFTFAVLPGSHTITIKNVGSTYSDLDQIVLAAATTPLTIGTYQEDDTALIYNGTWASAAGAVINRKYTNDPFGNVIFTIDNTVGNVTIYRTTYVSSVYGSMQVYLDDSPTPMTTINNTSAAFLMGQAVNFSVTQGNHIITLKNVGSMYSDIDQIVLLAPGSQSQPVMPTVTLTPTVITATPTLTATEVTLTATPTVSETPVSSASPTATATTEPAQTATPTVTETPVPTSTAVSTAVPSLTPIPTDVPTNTPIPTVVPTSTPIPTVVPTSTPIPTDISTNTLVPTDVPTNTPVPTEVPTAG